MNTQTFLIISILFGASSAIPAQQSEKDHNVSNELLEQKDAWWHLQRISNAGPITTQDEIYYEPQWNKKGVYRYPSSAGAGVDIYVDESDIMTHHSDFSGRAKLLSTEKCPTEEQGKEGHGTQVAGVAAGCTYGVAKKANIIHACDFQKILENHEKRKKESDWRGSVLNLSYGYALVDQAQGVSDGLKKTYQSLIDAGIHVITAAGNQKRDACGIYPGAFSRVLPVINVGAISMSDRLQEFSNVGDCVDIFAPGDNVMTADINGGFVLSSGTSLAAPFVAGLVAVELSRESNRHLRLDPSAMKKYILNIGFQDAVLDARGDKIPGTVLAGNRELAGMNPSRPMGEAFVKEIDASSVQKIIM
ncbi:Cerevisin [Arthrobotrys entomopaga]|nr:Cerevisin [Arthrobotrys entomopaga]